MRKNEFGLLAVLVAVCLVFFASSARAQDDVPPPKHAGMQITFLPPPMEGTLSLGIYDKKGKLVRALAREATDKDFVVGLNGLITFWDGKDDAGKPMTPGLYFARGYSVGAIEVEGVALHGNDWITDDDAPRPAHVVGLRSLGDDQVEVVLHTLAGAEVRQTLRFDTQPPEKPAVGDSASVEDGKVKLVLGGEVRAFPLEAGETPVDATLGAPDRLWIIVRTATGTEVRAYTLAGEFLRRMAYAPGDPLPLRILAARGAFAARWSEQIMLLEQNEKLQRFRTLALPQKPAAGDAPAWETILEKSIWLGDSFDAVHEALREPGGKPFTTDKDFLVHLINNPLIKEQATTARVTIGFNAGGSFIQTDDGLPLRRVTETPTLKWAVIGHEGSGKLLTIFQSDGTVVEEFRARRLASMMAFDAGEYEWTGK